MTGAFLARHAPVTGSAAETSYLSDPETGRSEVSGPDVGGSDVSGPDVSALDVSGSGVSAEDFRRALGRHAAGVVVVTAAPPAGPAGLTATSFTSVSVDPPLVSFYVARSSTTLPELRKAPTFAVNVLGHDQSDVAARFASRDVDRFAAPTRWRPGPAGEPLLEGTSARLLCNWHTTSQIGDHLLIVGQVTAIQLGTAEHPLLYHRGSFGHFQPHTPY